MAENTVVRTPHPSNQADTQRNGKSFVPRVDILETPSEVLVLADLPGVRPEDIDLRYERGELHLRGKLQPSAPTGRAVLQEFESGDFYRAFQIHEAIDPNKIDAEYKNGVLTVHLPKQEAVKPKQVQVRAG